MAVGLGGVWTLVGVEDGLGREVEGEAWLS